jgi:hypothetical protein
MTKPGSYPNPNEHELLNSVFLELERLEQETAKLARTASIARDEKWTVYNESIGQCLQEWQNTLAATELLVVSILNGKSRIIADLSDIKINGTNEFSIFSKNSVIENEYGSGSMRNALLAISSQDMHVDFSQKVVFVPLSFSEKVCALVVARVPGICESNYFQVQKHTVKLSENFRKVTSPLLHSTRNAEAS